MSDTKSAEEREREIAEAQRTAEEIARRLYVAGSPEHPVCSECDESWGTHDPDGCWVTNYVIPTTREAVTTLLARERERIEDEVDAWHAAWVAHVELLEAEGRHLDGLLTRERTEAATWYRAAQEVRELASIYTEQRAREVLGLVAERMMMHADAAM